MSEIEHAVMLEVAKRDGYNDAMFDGISMPECLPCQCDECRAAYDKAQEKAIDEIFASRGVIDAS